MSAARQVWFRAWAGLVVGLAILPTAALAQLNAGTPTEGITVNQPPSAPLLEAERATRLARLTQQLEDPERREFLSVEELLLLSRSIQAREAQLPSRGGLTVLTVSGVVTAALSALVFVFGAAGFGCRSSGWIFCAGGGAGVGVGLGATIPGFFFMNQRLELQRMKEDVQRQLDSGSRTPRASLSAPRSKSSTDIQPEALLGGRCSEKEIGEMRAAGMSQSAIYAACVKP